MQKRQKGILLVLCALCTVQVLALQTTISPIPAIRCSNTTAADNCYTQFPYPKKAWRRVTFPILYHIQNVIDLCTHTRPPFEYSCVDYFCENPLPIIQQTFSTLKHPGEFHIQYTHYCLYCNHYSRDELLTRIANNSCPYLWTIPKQSQCTDIEGSPTPTLIGNAFSDYQKLVDSNSSTIQTSPERMINITYLRNTMNPVTGPIPDTSYICYCSSMNRFGVVCDTYTAFWTPLRYNAVPFIAFGLRVLLLVTIFYLVFLPRFGNLCRSDTPVSCRTFFIALIKMTRKLSFHVIFFMSVSLVLLSVEDFTTVAPPFTTFTNMTNNFRIAAWFCSFISYGTLLVIWANIYQRSTSQKMNHKVALRLKILLGVFYAINFTLLVGFVIALFVLQFKGPADALKYVRAAADASAFTLTFILSIGFLVYGIAMYRVLRKANAESSIWKVRFTQFMMLTVPAMWVTSAWLLLYVIHSQSTLFFGVWLTLFFPYIIDASFLVLFVLMVFVLFDKKMFLALPWHKCCYKEPNNRQSMQFLDQPLINETRRYNE